MSSRGRDSLRSTAAAKAAEVDRLVAASLEAIKRGDWTVGAERALAALHLDEANGHGWWLLAIARENAGDPQAAFLCYERALSLLPNHGEIAADLHRTAGVAGASDRLIPLLEHFLQRNPQD